MNLDTLAKIIGKPIAVVDIEHTGTHDPYPHIIEIAYQLHGYGLEKKSFQTFVNTTQSISSYAYRVHRISHRQLINAPTFETLLPPILWIHQNCLLVGYNSNSCDLPIINKNALPHLNGKSLPMNEHTLDVQRLWHRLSGQKKGTLTDVANHYSASIGTTHRAMGDVVTTQNVLIKMINQHGIAQVFKGTPHEPRVKRFLDCRKGSFL